mgnify:CR=1 FL=1
MVFMYFQEAMSMKKIVGIMIVLGAILLSNIAVELPSAYAAYWCDWCDERGICHERNTDCPYWQDGQQAHGRQQGHHRRAAHCQW